MAHLIGSYALDHGLAVFDTDAVGIYLCSQDPTTYTEATSTYALGSKTWGAGGAFGAPEDASPNGRQVNSTAISDGEVTVTGTATDWAAVDASHLLANGSLLSPQSVVDGNTFILASFKIRFPNQ